MTILHHSSAATTTLNAIRKQDWYEDRWTMLLASLDKTSADDEPLPLLHILNSNGLFDAVSCLRALGPAHDRWVRHMACDFAVTALKYCPYGETRPAEAIRVSRLFADGKATQDELVAARDAALAAEEAATADREAGWAARDAGDAARDSALVKWVVEETAARAARAAWAATFMDAKAAGEAAAGAAAAAADAAAGAAAVARDTARTAWDAARAEQERIFRAALAHGYRVAAS